MRYVDINNMEELDAAREKLAGEIGRKGREVSSMWTDMQEAYSPTGLLAYGIKKISGKIRYDQLVLWAIRAIKRHI